MIRDEILAMEPGPKLNLLVTSMVMGWVAWEEKRGDYHYVVFQKPGEKEPYRRSQRWELEKERYRIIDISEINPMKHIVASRKDYSGDISAAWEVVEHLNCKYSFSIRRLGDYFYQDPEYGWEAVFTSRSKLIVLAKTAPEAICKSALLATLS